MNIPYFDAHCDTLSAMLQKQQGFANNALHVELNRGSNYQPWAQFFAMFASDKLKTKAGFVSGGADFNAQYQLFEKMVAEHEDTLHFCKNIADLKHAEENGKVAGFLSVEGAELLDCSLERLEDAYEKGVRMLTLTWNYHNALSGSNIEHPEKGLTEHGRAFVQRCRELGVLVDVSHLSPKGFWDVAELLDVPFVASHSNAASLWEHSRNITDAQFLQIVKAGGVCGINLYADFLGENATIDTVIAHIAHFLDLGGAKSIAVGADLDGCERLPLGINAIEDIWKIADRLLQKNYPESLICDIFYENLRRVVEEVCVI